MVIFLFLLPYDQATWLFGTGLMGGGAPPQAEEPVDWLHGFSRESPRRSPIQKFGMKTHAVE